MAKTTINNIGVLGGTFDPIHLGHLIIAEIVREEIALDQILFLPARIHPLKKNDRITPPGHRLRMLELAVRDNPAFSVSKMELQRENTSFTVDTLRQLRETFSTHTLYFLMGLDNVNQFHLWKEPEEIIRLCQVVVLGRPGIEPHEEARQFLPYFKFLDIPLLEISSTDIRNRVRQGKSIRYLVPRDVENYIREHRLYR